MLARSPWELRPCATWVQGLARSSGCTWFRRTGAPVAKELLEALEKRARERGLDAVRLDTHERLTETNGLYGSMGYREIDDYNGNASANRWFEKVLA